MKSYKLAAQEVGYEFWYDRSIRLWAATKEGYETQYFTKDVCDRMGLAKFYQFLKSNDRIE